MPLTSDKGAADRFVIERLDHQLRALERILEADVLTLCGLILGGMDGIVRDELEALTDRKPKLVVIVETDGGYIEVVERIVAVLRHHYGQVDFVVPDRAMSAGTVLVMSGDAIHMDYHSVLGPIDPQVQQQDGKMIPARGYLAKYDQLIEKSREGTLTTAELAFLMQKFDPAELYYYEQALELSVTLLEKWLAEYKFKDWTETETQKRPVTPEMKQKRAWEITQELNKTEHWRSHGRGISMQALREELKLKIDDLGGNEKLRVGIRNYYGLLVDYKEKTSASAVLHTRKQFRPF